MADRITLAITGYYGTGSSAVIDLLRSYDEVYVAPYDDRAYEHVVFYASGGLFDLCRLLGAGNSPFSSDMAVNNFIQAMHRLNDNDLAWFGSYEKLFGKRFMDACMRFVDAISETRPGTTSDHVVKSRFSLVKAAAQLAVRLTTKRRFSQYGVHFKRNGMPVRIALPTEEELYSAAREFTSAYFALFDDNGRGRVKVFDHCIWPSQVDAFDRCFDDSFKVIVTQRDPRDIFLSNKHVWFTPPLGHGEPHFPLDPVVFAEEWEKTVVKHFDSSRVMTVQFEDLIYRNGDTVAQIESFLGLDKPTGYAKLAFDPNKSIENTQLFNVNDEWRHDGERVKELLPDYVYRFPYERTPARGKMFDNQEETK